MEYGIGRFLERRSTSVQEAADARLLHNCKMLLPLSARQSSMCLKIVPIHPNPRLSQLKVIFTNDLGATDNGTRTEFHCVLCCVDGTEHQPEGRFRSII